MAREFKRRGLTLTFPNSALTDDDFLISRAIIFSFDSKHKGESIGTVKTYAPKAAEHGLLVIVHTSESGEDRLIQAHLLDFPEVSARFIDFPRPIKQFSFKKPAYELAEMAARHSVGPPLNPNLLIKGTPPQRESDILLLKRAFGDCNAITVDPLTKGLSGARVLAVYAEFPEAEAAPYPLPYFAKIDSCRRILKEYEAYDRFVIRHVPFSQRPNCEPKRCLLGLTDGILVGDFVDNSQSLSDVVRGGGARSIIHSLFDDALRGWRQQAYRRNDRTSLAEIQTTILKPDQIQDAHVQTAKAFGARLNAVELVHLLDDPAKHQYRRGPVHGDLNAQNIRVRNGEAILIDFYKSDIGALVSDLASLEVAICFSLEADTSWAGDKDGAYLSSERFKEWRRHIDTLFTFQTGEFGMVPPLQEQPCPHDWMWSACRQLRLMARYIEPTSEDAYAYMLSAHLLRMTMFPAKDGSNGDTPDVVIRSYAYWCAERILRAITREETIA